MGAATAEIGAGPRRDMTVAALRVAVVALVLAALATPAIATVTGLREFGLVNGDEAVAALLPHEFAHGTPSVLFPGNAYQGVLELPAYAVLWVAAGADLLPMRLLHQAIWVAAMAVWFVAALEPARRAGSVTRRSYWWSALVVAGLLGVTSAVGWGVWYRIYPGYQSGALLGGLAVLTALRATRDRELARLWWWVGAGFLAGAAIYAQPMHAVATPVVMCLALSCGRTAVVRRLAVTTVGVVVGSAPLLMWNLGHDLAILRPRGQPAVEHPEWGYADRAVGMLRTTGRVLVGRDEVPTAPLLTWAAALCVGSLVVLALWGAWALLRGSWQDRSLLVAPAAMLLGLPLLRVMSLQSDPRYAVGWWPGMVVVVAAGAAAAAGAQGASGRVLRAALAGVVVVHLAVVATGASDLLAEQRDRPNAVEATPDLVEDLRRCGVDAVWGNYWAVYPVLWASGDELQGDVTWGPERLTAFLPEEPLSLQRIAVLLPAAMTDPAASAALATEGTGRGAAGWLGVVDPDSGVRIALEQTVEPLPADCLGASGLQVR